MTKQILAPVAVLSIAGAASAQFTLIDDNSVIEFSGPFDDMEAYTVEGVDQLAVHLFGLDIGLGVEALNNTNITSATLSDGDFDGDDDSLEVIHTVGDYDVVIFYSLKGGPVGSDTSGLDISLSVEFFGQGDPLFSLYEYGDFDLNDTSLDSSVVFTGPGTITQTDAGLTLQEEITTVSPAPTAWEVGFVDDVEDAFLNGDPDGTSSFGPGNGAWVLAWEDQTAADFNLSKLITVNVPTPGSMMLLSVAGLAALKRRRG